LNKKLERRAALERQGERLQARIEQLNYWSDRYSWWRLAIFLGGLSISILAFVFMRWVGPWPGLALGIITIVAFSITAHYHRKVDRSIVRHRIWLQMNAAQIARMRLDWDALPAEQIQEHIPDHPFEIDLDVTGERSLHRLLSTAISDEGNQRLAGWLLNTRPDRAAMCNRQTLLQELAPMTIFRNKLLFKSLLSVRYAREHLEGERLISWLKAPTEANPRNSTLYVSVGLSALFVLLFLLFLFTALPPIFPIAVLLLSISWFFARRKERGDLFDEAYYVRDAFGQLRGILEYLETYRYGRHLQLKKLCEPFFRDKGDTGDKNNKNNKNNKDNGPSLLLKKLSRIASMATLEKNQLAWIIVNALVPWDAYVALQLQRYKAQLVRRLPQWLDIWFELEALCSLANFAYLNPEYALPKVVENDEDGENGENEAQSNRRIVFQAKGLGHPLIEEEQKVVNDFAMHNLGDIVLITGSNMSGKSTFLRTLGINLCLAYAGAPVNAQSFSTSLFRVFTTIKVSDSVTEGYSYFYAEVRRLRALLDELQRPNPYPLFFLIDEIFKGTNNRERLIGSRAYIRALVGKNCAGAISTHDLELVKLADELPGITNYHFREDVVNGEMVFEYKLFPGPSPTTNALKIMQLEGLPIE
jgi:ABC-type multidrug transport system fused ATPase/permease subunit